jgi:hypothetical protein
VSQLADDLLVSLELHAFCLEDLAELSADVVGFDLGDSDRLGSAINKETQDLFLVVPLPIAFL